MQLPPNLTPAQVVVIPGMVRLGQVAATHEGRVPLSMLLLMHTKLSLVPW